MKCKQCGSSIENNVSFYPVQPKGTKDRNWMCEECLAKLPILTRDKLIKAGTKQSLKLRLVIMKNQLIDKLIG